jgi:small subunit ribosomal protein S19e
MPGVSVNDVDPQQFVVAVAKYLKRSGKIAVPKYNDFAKTASYKELPPMDPDWFYVRAGMLFQNFYLFFCVFFSSLSPLAVQEK